MKKYLITILGFLFIFLLSLNFYFYNYSNIKDNKYLMAELTDSSLNNTEQQNVKNPETGINNYYLTLGLSILILGVVVYTLNKKNIFKKI